MQRVSTYILRLAIVIIGLLVLALCGVVFPLAIRAELGGDFDYGIILIGLYLPAVPLVIGLWQALRLLSLIDHNKAFSAQAVDALGIIRRCAFAVSGLFAAGMPYIFRVADNDDAPGLVAMALILTGSSFIIATAAGVFERLFRNAVHLKKENDLTV